MKRQHVCTLGISWIWHNYLLGYSVALWVAICPKILRRFLILSQEMEITCTVWINDCLNQLEIILNYQFTITLGNETESYQSKWFDWDGRHGIRKYSMAQISKPNGGSSGGGGGWTLRQKNHHLIQVFFLWLGDILSEKQCQLCLRLHEKTFGNQKYPRGRAPWHLYSKIFFLTNFKWNHITSEAHFFLRFSVKLSAGQTDQSKVKLTGPPIFSLVTGQRASA